jgi:hypothetical protein
MCICAVCLVVYRCLLVKFLIVALSCVMFLVQLFFCRESIECFPGIVSRCLFSPLVTITVVPRFTGMTKHFIFHIRRFSILIFLYFNIFLVSFCTAFLSDGIATSISKQILSFLFVLVYLSDYYYYYYCCYYSIPQQQIWLLT